MATKMTDRKKNFESKKCPECLTYLAPDAKKCFSCGAKVKDVDKMGIAKRPINWKSYLFSLLSAVVLGLYLWWAFF